MGFRNVACEPRLWCPGHGPTRPCRDCYRVVMSALHPRGSRGLFAIVVPTPAILLLSLLAGAACRKAAAPGAESSAASTPAPQKPAHAGALPLECDRYRRALEDCMASPHYPRDFLEAQRSALEQMMVSMRTDDVPAAERPAARAAAVRNCVDSLDTLQESAKQTCPEILEKLARP